MFKFSPYLLPLCLSRLRIRLQCGRPGFDPWVGKIPWRRDKLPTPVFWPGEFHMGLQRVRHDWVTFTSLHFTSYINALKCSTWTKSYKQNKWSGNIFLSMETFVSKLKHLLRTMLSSRDKMMTKGAFFYKHNFSWKIWCTMKRRIFLLWEISSSLN